jgi:hypothetical protein
LDVNVCPECKVPEPFQQGQIWLNNGDVVQALNPEARMVFIECENLDPLFKNIGDIIGMPIEPFVINIAARGTDIYMKSLIPEAVMEMVMAKQAEIQPFLDATMTYCHILGYGRYESVGYRYENDEDDFAIIRIEAPFSVPEAAGAIAGVTSSLVGGEQSVTHEEISPGLYEFTVNWTEFPETLKEKLRTVPHRHREGDIELERCPTCGVPAALSAFRWHLDRGLVVNSYTGRRMAMLGPELLDGLFRALEAELGETIPNMVVESQRRFTKTGFYSIEEVSNEGDFRTQLALRGMGNLKELQIGKRGVYMRLENAAIHLMIVGMLQGLFEMALDVESNVDWFLTEEGDLDVEIRPKAIMESMDT